MIDAFEKLIQIRSCFIAGGASHTNDYLEEIKNRVAKNDKIIMTGFVQGNELDELFSNCYLYCLPSDVEGIQLV